MLQIDKAKCNGCHACAALCPKQCISMVSDEEGFWYPKIDEACCTNCGLCEKICPTLNPPSLKQDVKLNAYAAINTSEEVRQESSSGGLFSEIAGWIIENGGVVFGAAFAEDFSVEHTYVESMEELSRFRGSKYVQSKIGDSYRQAEEFLKADRWVLFSGTPCQIGGLYAFLKKPYERLITQDIICHGVPSPKVWQMYIEHRSALADARPTSIAFRNKTEGWKRFSMRFEFENGEVYIQNMQKDPYLQAFLKNLSLRPSCYACAFKTKVRQSDITLADYWGVQKIHPELHDDKGTSLIFLNSEKGERIFDALKDRFTYIPTDTTVAIANNSAMISSVSKNGRRKKFFSEVSAENFEQVTKKYSEASFGERCMTKIKKILKRIIKG